MGKVSVSAEHNEPRSENKTLDTTSFPTTGRKEVLPSSFHRVSVEFPTEFKNLVGKRFSPLFAKGKYGTIYGLESPEDMAGY